MFLKSVLRLKDYSSSFTRVLILSAAILILCIAAGCPPKPVGKVYRIGLGPWVGFGPLYLAQEKGFFKESGVQVDLTVLTGLAERNSSLKSGQIDGLAAPVDYFVLSAGNHHAQITPFGDSWVPSSYGDGNPRKQHFAWQ